MIAFRGQIRTGRAPGAYGSAYVRGDDCGGMTISDNITVAQYGKANFTTIQAAIDTIPVNNNRWVKIYISAGMYREKVNIPYNKPCIILEGQGRDVTIITYNGHLETDTSATFTSSPSNVVAKEITFENSYNMAAILHLHYKKIENYAMPALAARVYGDKSAFYNCSFVGYQDTLWDVEGRHYFKNCTIIGAVDFIFGAGQSIYEDCLIVATSAGFITAQGRNSLNDTSGFIFRRGTVFGWEKTFLGRAWGPYSRVIFYETNLTSAVAPLGWYSWTYAQHEDKFTYAEIDCKGLSANTTHRAQWMNKTIPVNASQMMSQFSISAFIDQDGWLGKLPM
ncbi:putative pectinesterase 52 [Gastrolobium bilobum]|uniref:putative pectinesterase 52 n=1 Tax=Gastrolobium bilobum TaxID=150636 RepID=UPI002AB1FAFD|nr:putative pectinesterase 52 [Gastrolobium bilobum]